MSEALAGARAGVFGQVRGRRGIRQVYNGVHIFQEGPDTPRASLPAVVAAALDAAGAANLVPSPTPVEPLERLDLQSRGGPRLLVKRDDLIPFAFGGNKVRKLDVILADARAKGADTVVTCGGVQSNHARVTAAAAARLGLRSVLVLSGAMPGRLTGNLLLSHLFGAEIISVPGRADRAPRMQEVVGRLGAEGRRPYAIPLGASTGLGALGYVRAVGELLGQIDPPDVIVHATSSGGTQAGIVAGCALAGLNTRVIGVSADEPPEVLSAEVRRVLVEIEAQIGVSRGALAAAGEAIDVDASFVGEGYGVPTKASREAIAHLAQREAIVLDPTYTAKAMAGLLAYVRDGRFRSTETVLFWHTGGQVGLFA